MFKPCRLTVAGNKYHVDAEQRVTCYSSPAGYVAPGNERSMVLNEVKRLRRNRDRRFRDQAMRDIGMVKVRGALGGTYWE